MIAIERILVPTDFSPPSETALRYGKALAERFGAMLHILHVAHELLTGQYVPEVYIPTLAAPDTTVESEIRGKLEALIDPRDRDKFQIVTALKAGVPDTGIVEYASMYKIDLIVMGTHGRGAIGHMLMGSVTEKVVRRAPCPVLTVRHAQHEFVVPEDAQTAG